MSTFLVTGGCGFIGSYVIDELLKSENLNKIFCVDKMGIGSDTNNIRNDNRIEYIYKDISETSFREDIDRVDYIIHLAAESHVDRSITDPNSFIDSNVKGTANILSVCREDNARMVHVSTDEVYGHMYPGDEPFSEENHLKPRSPYSASKAASDLIVQSYVTTFDVNASITRCCNNYGPRQHDEKLIPTVIRSIVRGEKIPVYGTGENIREWIHAEDHAKSIIEVLYNGIKGEVYNIPGSSLKTNLEVINEIISNIEVKYPEYKQSEYISFIEDRLGHDFMYQLQTNHNLSAVENQRMFNLSETIDFYIKKYS